MASTLTNMVICTALAAALCLGASAQSSSCTTALIGLSPCLNYISGKETTPSSSCCSQFASVVKSEPQCLCTVLNGGAASSLGITVNQTQALALPSACNVQTPAISQCSSGNPSGTPSPSNSPSGDRSKTVPAAGIGSLDGSSASVPFLLNFSLVIAVTVSSLAAISAF